MKNIKLKSLITEKFPDYRELGFLNNHDKLGFTSQDMKNIRSFSSAFGKRFKQLIVKKQLVRALPSMFLMSRGENPEGIVTTAEKLMSDEIIDLIKNGNLG